MMSDESAGNKSQKTYEGMARVTRHSSLATRHWFSASEGQAQVEFLLSILFVLLLIFGIFELIMLLYTYSVLADSAKEGVRYAIVHGSESSSATGPTCPCSAIDGVAGTGVVKTYARYSFHDTTQMIVTVAYPDLKNTVPSRVRVVVSYPYQWLFGFSWGAVTVNAASEGRIAF